jgi:hypothetical protein
MTQELKVSPDIPVTTSGGYRWVGYAVLFVICAFAYLVAFALNHLCAPRFDELSAPELQK